MPDPSPLASPAIVADSSACLPAELIERYGIIIVPLAMLFDGELYHDGALSARDFYARLEAARKPPTTAAAAPGDFLEAFRRAQASGARAVLCLTLSTRYSGTHSAAVNAGEMAAKEMPELAVRVVDTGGIAMTHGFAVLAAARAAQEGRGLDGAAAAARAVGAGAQLVGALDTMKYLARSGRVPWIVHWAASLLQIKPVLAAQGEEVRPIARVRTRAKALDRLAAYIESWAQPACPVGRPGGRLHIAVMHAEAPERAAELAERLRRLAPAELLVTEFTPVMGVHTGPGFVGAAFYRGDETPPPAPAPRPARRPWERDARVLEEALGPLPAPVQRPALVLLSGLPGSGKSHFRRALQKRCPLAAVESDALRRVLFRRPQHTEKESGRLFAAIHALLEQLLARGIPVVFDATNLKEAQRIPVYGIAEKHGARLVVVQLTAPEEVIRRRLTARGRGHDPLDVSAADIEVYEKMKGDLEPVRRPHFLVDTSEKSGAVLDTIARELQAVGV
ncbi:MAG: DegV family protein [Dehalococcoidia bacterium]|nr:DegV family protein [Dehalococcoidia bacterium]